MYTLSVGAVGMSVNVQSIYIQNGATKIEHIPDL